MPEKGWRVITVKQEIYDHLMNEYQKTKKEWLLKKGINSFTGYVTYRLAQLEEDGTLEMLNHNESGVRIIDRKLGNVVDIQFNPKGIYCVVCDASYCEHVRYALAQEDIKEIVRQKRKEGWKLPDV